MNWISKTTVITLCLASATASAIAQPASTSRKRKVSERQPHCRKPVVVPASSACVFTDTNLEVKTATNLIVRLVNPPRTKVTLSIDRAGGFHHELVWDPAVGDGLKHDIILPVASDYTLNAYAEEDRIQSNQLVVRTTTQFSPPDNDPSGPSGCFGSTQRTVVVRANVADTEGVAKVLSEPPHERTPQLTFACESGGVEMSEQYLDPKRLYAASVARGFLDTAAPAVVTDSLALLAEIAVERAKEGAFEIVRDRFVGPICDEFRLKVLGLGDEERAFPRTCAMLESMRLQDLFSSGRNLVEAARDDIRLLLVPRLVAQARLPAAVRDLALIALDLGNKMLDGGGDELAEIDLLVTQLDRMFRRGVPATLEGVKNEFIVGARADLDEVKADFIDRVLNRILPTDPGALLSKFVVKTPAQKELVKNLKLEKFDACKRIKDTEKWVTGASKALCIAELKKHILTEKDWLAEIQKLVPSDELVGLVDSVREAKNKAQSTTLATFAQWLDATAKTKGLDQYLTDVSEPLLRSCAVRVTIAIVKWCSGRDSCTAGRIATALDNPESLFKAPPISGDIRENMCWNLPSGTNPRTLRLPPERGRYVELATRALAFLTPPAKGEERARVQAVLHWMFDLAKTIDPSAVESVEKLEEILALFERRDYVRAIAQAVTTAIELNGCTEQSCRPEPFQKAMQLVGALASYLQVYDDTKGADPAEAKAARKRAIESLIDSSTDRRGRSGAWIFSLGVSAGLTGGVRYAPSADNRIFSSVYDSYEGRLAGMWRVPLGFALQKIPLENRYRGYHFAVTLADLGNFLRHDDDDIQWSDFLQVGVQAGITLGNRKHAVVVALDASWSPGTYARKVAIGRQFEQVDGAFAAGITVAYYLPIFDLN